jgi:outer membrane protein OmpA-like peptidoglycan-associated protein
MKINVTKSVAGNSRKVRAAWIVLPAFLLFGGSAAYGAPQEQQQGVVVGRDANGQLTYKVTVVEHTTRAINYQHRSGSTEVDFRGTDLMPEARGEANVNSKQGRIEIKVRVEKMNSPTQYGPEYLTYVLWAVTPEGRPKNLGEVLLSGGNDHSSMEVTTDLQTFGLIITAEPYFAVTQPSNVVVMENVVSDKTVGTIEPINVHYELLERGQYVLNVDRSQITPYTIDRKTPLELYEARNAVRIAKWTGADTWAPDAYQRAAIALQNAEDEFAGRSSNKKTIQQNSRDAAQTAEDARLITIRKIEDKQTADAQAAAQAREADSAAAAAAADRQRAEEESRRRAAEEAKARADADAQRALEQQRAAEAASAAAAAQAQQQVAAAEAEKARLREQLRDQLNQVLATREEAGKLIVNMSDVLFDFGQYTLKPGAKEKLAKISGILISHPGLTLEVDGHTDSVGSDMVNLKLSEQRASTVREYLVAQGVQPDTISAHGFGKDKPVATNDTAAGRQLNRRVEIVVAGSSIASNGAQ